MKGDIGSKKDEFFKPVEGKPTVGEYAEDRALWMKAAAMGAHNSLVGLAETNAMMLPFLAVSPIAGAVLAATGKTQEALQQTGIEPVERLAKASAEFVQGTKAEQAEYNKEMLERPVVDRLSTGATNLAKGVLSLAGAPLGFGPLGSAKQAEAAGGSLIRGAVGYYASLLDPSMTGDTLAADPFAAIVEVAPMAGAASAALRAKAIKGAEKAVRAGKSIPKRYQGLDAIAEILAPADQLFDAPPSRKSKSSASPGTKAAEQIATDAGVSPAAVAEGKAKVETMAPDRMAVAPEPALRAANATGRALRGAFWGAIALEPVTVLTGVPMLGYSVGAAAHPAMKAAIRAYAKAKGRTVGEVQAAIDHNFNDPNAVGNPDVAAAVNDVVEARKVSATAKAYATSIAKMIEGGAELLPDVPGSALDDAIVTAPEPSRLGEKFILDVDGSIKYDPVGTSVWFDHAAAASDARVKARALEVYRQEARKEATRLKWSISDGRGRARLAEAVRKRETLDAATAGNAKLLDRRIEIGRRIERLADESGLDLITAKIDEFKQYRRAFEEFEEAVGGKSEALAAKAQIRELRRARRAFERRSLTGTQRIESASRWFEKVVAEVGDDVNPALVQRAMEAAAKLDELSASPVMAKWTETLNVQAALRDRLRGIVEMSEPYNVSWAGTRGKNTVTYKNAATFAKEFENAHAAAKKAHEEVHAGEPLTKERESVINKAQAMRSVMDEAAIDYIAVSRERTRALQALDAIADQFGGSPGAAKATLAQEVSAARKEASAALKAERRINAALEGVIAKNEANANEVMRAQLDYDNAVAALEKANGNLFALEAMLDSVDQLFKDQLVKDLPEEGVVMRGMAKKEVALERKLTVGEALAKEIEGEIAAIIDVNGEIKEAYEAILALGKMDEATKKAKKEVQNRYPADEKKALAASGAAGTLHPMSKVSLEWVDAYIDEMVGQVAELASSFAPFAGPIEPTVVRRLFSMAAMDSGIVHIMNKRAIGAIAEFMLPEGTPNRKKAIIDAKSQLSATVADLVAKSIATNEWFDPVFKFGDGREASLSTMVTSWMGTLDTKTKREFKASTATALGDYLEKQIQNHHMQGALVSELAAQMVRGDANNAAAPFLSFRDWATGSPQRMMVPFDLGELRQRLAGGPQAVEAFLRQAYRLFDPATPISDTMAQRLTPDGVVQWLEAHNNYVEVIGDSVKGREQAPGAGAAAVGGVLGAAAGAALAGPAGGVLGGIGGTVMGPQFAGALADNYNSLRDFIGKAGGDLTANQYPPLASVWVERGAAAALDAQVAYVRNVSRFESIMKIMLTSFSLPTYAGNILSNDFLTAVATGSMPGHFTAVEMPNAARAIAEWREGKSKTPYEFQKWEAFAETGLMETNILSDVARDMGTGRSKVDDVFRVAIAAYTMQDGLAKAAMFSSLYDNLSAAAMSLGEGRTMRLVAGNRKAHTLIRRGDDFIMKYGEVETVIDPNSKEFAKIIADSAKLTPSAMFFDFSSLPGLLRRRDTMLSGFAAPLFGWAFKALDAPGKSGLLSAVLGHAPSTFYLTNDPALLARKAGELAELAVRRSAILSATKGAAQASTQNRDKEWLLSYGAPLLSWAFKQDEDSDIINAGDQNNVLPFAPTLMLMKLGVAGVMGVMDLVGLDETSLKLEDAGLTDAQLTESQRRQQQWNNLWLNLYSGKGGLTRDLMHMFGLSGNFFFEGMSAANNPNTTPQQMKAIAKNTLLLFFPKTPVGVIDVLIGTMMPDSDLTTRRRIKDDGGTRPEDIWTFAARVLTGIGTRELDEPGARRRVRAVKRRIYTAMSAEVKREIKQLNALKKDRSLSPEKRDLIDAELDEKKELLRSQARWRSEMLRKSGLTDMDEGWEDDADED